MSQSSKTYSLELTFDQILSLVEKLPDKERISIAKKIDQDTFKKRFRSFNKRIKSNSLGEEEIIKEIKSVRKDTYEKKSKTGN